MKKTNRNWKIILVFVFFGFSAAMIWHKAASYTPEPVTGIVQQKRSPVQDQREPKPVSYVNLEVPYISEAPDNLWVGSWKNGCEEAVVSMAAKYYQDVTSVTVAEAKAMMQPLFDFQQASYGSDANSDTNRTLAFIKEQGLFDAKIVENPTLEQIKKELDQGRPVLGFHYGLDLHNKNIPFLPSGPSYHTTVIKGFDDDTRQFITNDPGDTVAGQDHRYDYEVYLNSLHDYNFSSGQADGPSRVLFTNFL